MVSLQDNSPVYKLTDFGLSLLVLEHESIHNISGFAGTNEYIAPEMNHNKQSYDGIKTDSYSLGVLLYLLIMKCFPLLKRSEKISDDYKFFTTLIDSKIDRSNEQYSIFFQKINNISILNILLGLLNPEPLSRWSVSDVLRKP